MPWLHRHRLFIIGIFIIAAATIILLLFARDERFYVGDVAIDPHVRIDAQQTYELILWEEEVIIPWAAKTQSEILMEGIRKFQELHPNVAVSYTIIDEEEARVKLAESLQSGTPPDVYGTGQGVVIPSKYQVPATPYLPLGTGDTGTFDDFIAGVRDESREGGPLWLPAATAMVRQDGVVWGWPKALWWQTWLGTVPDLEEAVWTGDDFMQWATSFDADGRPRSAPALNVLDVTFLEQWIHGLSSPGDGDHLYPWTEQQLARAAKQLRTLQREGLLPSKSDAASVARSRVESLLRGTTPIIGPVGPHLAQAIFRHRPDEFRLLPVPSGSSVSEPSRPAVLDVGAYFVFRHEAYKGDAHTRLAAELADFLAAHVEGWLVESLGLLPVRAAGWQRWNDATPLDGLSRHVLQRAVAGTSPPYSLNERLYAAAAREAVQPAWHFFWRNEVTGAEFASEAARALQSLSETP